MLFAAVQESPVGTKRTSGDVCYLVLPDTLTIPIVRAFAPAYRISVVEWLPRTAKPNARTETTLRTVAGRAFMVSA